LERKTEHTDKLALIEEIGGGSREGGDAFKGIGEE